LTYTHPGWSGKDIADQPHGGVCVWLAISAVGWNVGNLAFAMLMKVLPQLTWPIVPDSDVRKRAIGPR
jgi:hypothetical protein